MRIIEIGNKIQSARKNAGITQNELAQMLGVSRQSVSNWENNHAYPDIISVIKISDICKISLDSLLKDDEKMLHHLEESTNVVKTKSKHIKIIEMFLYIIVWAVSAVMLYLTGYEYDTVTNIIMFFVMPLAILAVSILIGFEPWGREKIAMPYLFGIMFSLLSMFDYYFVPFSNKHDYWFCLNSVGPMLVIGIALSYLGILVGNKIDNRNKLKI